jgi:hypothetical protein
MSLYPNLPVSGMNQSNPFSSYISSGQLPQSYVGYSTFPSPGGKVTSWLGNIGGVEKLAPNPPSGITVKDVRGAGGNIIVKWEVKSGYGLTQGQILNEIIAALKTANPTSSDAVNRVLAPYKNVLTAQSLTIAQVGGQQLIAKAKEAANAATGAVSSAAANAQAQASNYQAMLSKINATSSLTQLQSYLSQITSMAGSSNGLSPSDALKLKTLAENKIKGLATTTPSTTPSTPTISVPTSVPVEWASLYKQTYLSVYATQYAVMTATGIPKTTAQMQADTIAKSQALAMVQSKIKASTPSIPAVKTPAVDSAKSLYDTFLNQFDNINMNPASLSEAQSSLYALKSWYEGVQRSSSSLGSYYTKLENQYQSYSRTLDSRIQALTVPNQFNELAAMIQSATTLNELASIPGRISSAAQSGALTSNEASQLMAMLESRKGYVDSLKPAEVETPELPETPSLPVTPSIPSYPTYDDDDDDTEDQRSQPISIVIAAPVQQPATPTTSPVIVTSPGGYGGGGTTIITQPAYREALPIATAPSVDNSLMSPAEGPPLPRSFGIKWPWVK